MTAIIRDGSSAETFFSTYSRVSLAVATMQQIDFHPGSLWEREADRDLATPLQWPTRQGNVSNVIWRGADLATILLAESLGVEGIHAEVKRNAISRLKRRGKPSSRRRAKHRDTRI